MVHQKHTTKHQKQRYTNYSYYNPVVNQQQKLEIKCVEACGLFGNLHRSAFISNKSRKGGDIIKGLVKEWGKQVKTQCRTHDDQVTQVEQHKQKGFFVFVSLGFSFMVIFSDSYYTTNSPAWLLRANWIVKSSAKKNIIFFVLVFDFGYNEKQRNYLQIVHGWLVCGRAVVRPRGVALDTTSL
jgi:hypothetical protein